VSIQTRGFPTTITYWSSRGRNRCAWHRERCACARHTRIGRIAGTPGRLGNLARDPAFGHGGRMTEGDERLDELLEGLG
jgi:hypothetical protein